MEQASLLGVAALTAGVYLNTSSSTSTSKQGDSDSKSDSEGEQRTALRRLQRVYLPAHLLALFSDWLQGPYVFQLYRDYGYSEQVLYCTILIVLHCTVLYCVASRRSPSSSWPATSPPACSAASPGPWQTSTGGGGWARSENENNVLS